MYCRGYTNYYTDDTLPISVMVAMVIMRGSIIIISRLIDAIQIRQGILKSMFIKKRT